MRALCSLQVDYMLTGAWRGEQVICTHCGSFARAPAIKRGGSGGFRVTVMLASLPVPAEQGGATAHYREPGESWWDTNGSS
ncbi:hypothetical protein AAFF_G00288790 [Aldrovandia affinis]|uniref:Uncharacterized protein n=1 Tax=Aldrovandia affinis TaxID=143900 RepID=A0AAD7WSB3_9TELE|nr:hypothetical protein AAFF_G00288790 [Aldrovandia affinis]